MLVRFEKKCGGQRKESSGKEGNHPGNGLGRKTKLIQEKRRADKGIDKHGRRCDRRRPVFGRRAVLANNTRYSLCNTADGDEDSRNHGMGVLYRSIFKKSMRTLIGKPIILRRNINSAF